MFVNTESLQIVNLGNCTDANNLFDKSQEYNLIILEMKILTPLQLMEIFKFII